MVADSEVQRKPDCNLNSQFYFDSKTELEFYGTETLEEKRREVDNSSHDTSYWQQKTCGMSGL